MTYLKQITPEEKAELNLLTKVYHEKCDIVLALQKKQTDGFDEKDLAINMLIAERESGEASIALQGYHAKLKAFY
nr:hypothetical protein [Pedobacter panaciterrae]